ncbi:MAG: S-methyl-5'-thioadenosine phosphorylase [Pseudarthrobacter sp.]
MNYPSESLVRIGVIGGTGLYRLPEARVLDTVDVVTPFGPTSSPVTLARLGGPDGSVVAFLSRHGRGHSIAPQQINHRANLWALRSVGVEVVISCAAVGGLVRSYGTGTFAVPDQFIDRTWGRADTFYDGSLSAGVQHLPAADPYSAPLRAALIAALELQGEDFAPAATVAVINGPRFSTRAEAAALVQAGAHLVSMTQYPEPVLAAELNMHFATLAFITDANTGHDGSEPVTAEVVFDRLAAAQPRLLAVLSAVVLKVSAGLERTGSGVEGGFPARAFIDARAVATVMGAGQDHTARKRNSR